VIISAELAAMQSILLLTEGADLPARDRRDGFFSFMQNTTDLAAYRIVRFHPSCQVSTSADGEELEEQETAFQLINLRFIK